MPDVVVFNAAISSCEKSHQWQRALTLLQQMPMLRVTCIHDECPGDERSIVVCDEVKSCGF